MRTAWIATAGHWRHRRAAALGSVLLVAAATAVALSAAMGARRTETAFPRMLEATNVADVLANPDLGAETELDFDEVAALPGVDEVGIVAGLFVATSTPDGEPDFGGNTLVFAADNDTMFQDTDRFLMLDGRMPDPDRPDEVLIDRDFADRLHLEVGDRTALQVPNFSTVTSEDELPPFDPYEMTVAGIGINEDDVLVDDAFAQDGFVVTRAFLREHEELVGFYGLFVHLAGGAHAVPEFRREVEALVPDEGVEFKSTSVATESIQRAIRPEVLALRAFAVISGMIGLAVIAQGLVRQATIDDEEAAALRAVGLTRRQLAVGAISRIGVLAAGGALLGALVTVCASPLFPVGFVRIGEPDPGIDANFSYLAVGVLVAVGVILVLVTPAVWRTAGRRASAGGTARRTPAALRLAREAGVGPATATGIQFALAPGSARGSAATWTTVLGGGLAVVALTSALTFGAGLAHLVDAPRAFGWGWDAAIDESVDEFPVLADALRADGRVTAWSPAIAGRLTLDGVPIPAIGIVPAEDDASLTIVEGRAPNEAGEIALGARTLRRLGVHIGDNVEATSPDGETAALRVVGQAVFPGLGTYSGADRTELGLGALATRGAIRDLGPPIEKGLTFIDLGPGVDSVEFAEDLTDDLLETGAEADAFTVDGEPQRPSDIVALDRVRSRPVVLAAILAALILAQLLVTLLGAHGGRRRELAVLTTLGFLRRQVAATVTWQTVTLTAACLLVGVPVGIAVGRWSWTSVVDRLGALAQPVTPGLLLVGLTLATVAVAAATSFLAGSWLARRRPAAELRAE